MSGLTFALSDVTLFLPGNLSRLKNNIQACQLISKSELNLATRLMSANQLIQLPCHRYSND